MSIRNVEIRMSGSTGTGKSLLMQFLKTQLKEKGIEMYYETDGPVDVGFVYLTPDQKGLLVGSRNAAKTGKTGKTGDESADMASENVETGSEGVAKTADLLAADEDDFKIYRIVKYATFSSDDRFVNNQDAAQHWNKLIESQATHDIWAMQFKVIILNPVTGITRVIISRHWIRKDLTASYDHVPAISKMLNDPYMNTYALFKLYRRINDDIKIENKRKLRLLKEDKNGEIKSKLLFEKEKFLFSLKYIDAKIAELTDSETDVELTDSETDVEAEDKVESEPELKGDAEPDGAYKKNPLRSRTVTVGELEKERDELMLSNGRLLTAIAKMLVLSGYNESPAATNAANDIARISQNIRDLRAKLQAWPNGAAWPTSWPSVK